MIGILLREAMFILLKGVMHYMLIFIIAGYGRL